MVGQKGLKYGIQPVPNHKYRCCTSVQSVALHLSGLSAKPMATLLQSPPEEKENDPC